MIKAGKIVSTLVFLIITLMARTSSWGAQELPQLGVILASDHATLQTAIDATQGTGKILIVDNNFQEEVTITDSLIMVGTGTAVISAPGNGTEGAIIRIQAGTRHVTIRDLMLDGSQGVNKRGIDVVGTERAGVKNVLIENCHIKNIGLSSIRAYFVDNLAIKSVTIDRSNTSGNEWRGAIVIGDPEATSSENCRNVVIMYTKVNSPGAKGISCVLTSYLNIIGCQVRNHGGIAPDGIYVGDNSVHVSIIGCLTQDGSDKGNGIKVSRGASRVRIMASSIVNAANNGIYLQGGRNVYVAGNFIKSPGARGIHVQDHPLTEDDSEDIVITNNLIDMTVPVPERRGILVHGTGNGGLIEGNFITNSYMGIEGQSDWIIRGNIIRDAVKYGIVLDAGRHNVLIEGNSIINQRHIDYGILVAGFCQRIRVLGNIVELPPKETTMVGIQVGSGQHIVCENYISGRGVNTVGIQVFSHFSYTNDVANVSDNMVDGDIKYEGHTDTLRGIVDGNILSGTIINRPAGVLAGVNVENAPF